jgi:alkylation response protein AidB-like acyl-CoA dehydrogenase
LDFEFTEEQKVLSATSDRFLKEAYAWESRQRHVHAGATGRAEMMSRFRQMGWSALLVDEGHGGAGGGVIEALILMQASGRYLAVEPILEAFIVSERLIAGAVDQTLQSHLFASLIESETFIPAWHEDARYFSASELRTKATSINGVVSIHGAKVAVAGGDIATQFIIPAALDGCATALCLVAADASGVTVRPYSTIDDRGMADLSFDSAAATILASGARAVATIEEALGWARLCTTAEALGGIETALELTAQHLKTRRQFGQPLSKFQALQHRMADLHFEAEFARALSYRAMHEMMKTEAPQASWVSAAKLAACEAYKKTAGEGIQLHGAIGMAEEYPIGHYYRRALALEKAFGDTEHLYQSIEFEAAFQAAPSKERI